MKIIIFVALLATSVYGAPGFFDDIGNIFGDVADKAKDIFGGLIPSDNTKSDNKVTTALNSTSLSPQEVLTEALSKINKLKNNVTAGLSNLEESKNLISNIVSNLKEHGPVEELENIINNVTNNIDNSVDNHLNKILDEFSNFITEHINGSSKIVDELKTCAKTLNKNVDVTLPIKEYSKCITGPLKQIEDMVINITSAISDVQTLIEKIVTDGETCMKKFNGLSGITDGGLCIAELMAYALEKIANIAGTVTITANQAANFFPNLESNAEACAIKQSAVIVQTYAAAGVNATVCGIKGAINSV